MNTITFKGNSVQVEGELPAMGSAAPAFRLTAKDLSDVGLESFAGKVKIMNIIVSLDTSVCALSAKRFNEDVAKLPNTVIINVSADLPFAQKRFCESQSLSNVVNLSTMRAPSFGRDYGVQIATGPLSGLLCRAVVVLDSANRVVHVQRVPEIATEPDYAAALAAARAAR